MKRLLTFLFCVFLASLSFSEIRKSNNAAFSMIKTQNTDGRLTAKSYVQDSLFAQFDGIENIEYGKHNSNAKNWINLKGNPIIKNILFDDNSAIPTNNAYMNGNISNLKMTEDFTLHSCLVVCPFKWYNWTMIGIGTGAGFQNGICLSGMDSNRGNIVCYRKSYSGTIFNSVQIGLQSGKTYVIDITFCYDIKTYFVYVDGIYIGKSQILDENWNLNDVNVSIGCFFNRYNDIGDFRIHSILYYKRILTQDEISYNYDIDKVRFGL